MLFGLLHIITTGSIENAFTIFGIFTILIIIVKYTGNIFGPMVSWTILNNYNWYLIQWFFL